MPRARIIRLATGQAVPLAELRRLIAEQRQPEPEQPALFELRIDARPLGQRTAAERYSEPSLFDAIKPESSQ